ncbi:hypothetical protein B0J14DRAFT_239903 [Halenospora varia]|nr:hypothetical protein B0J14DRAFT_239903 [Halenospora varia]
MLGRRHHIFPERDTLASVQGCLGVWVAGQAAPQVSRILPGSDTDRRLTGPVWRRWDSILCPIIGPRRCIFDDEGLKFVFLAAGEMPGALEKKLQSGDVCVSLILTGEEPLLCCSCSTPTAQQHLHHEESSPAVVATTSPTQRMLYPAQCCLHPAPLKSNDCNKSSPARATAPFTSSQPTSSALTPIARLVLLVMSARHRP